MTKQELLKIVVGQARANGFEFKRWYTSRLGLEWSSADAAFAALESQRRYYALLFSHEFASNFWKPGAEITFQVSQQSFQRSAADGTVRTVTRKPYTRRSARKHAWKYHLGKMALAEDPLRYIRKYLRVDEELEQEVEESLGPEQLRENALANSGRSSGSKSKPPARPLPSGLPPFLRRPYP